MVLALSDCIHNQQVEHSVKGEGADSCCSDFGVSERLNRRVGLPNESSDAVLALSGCFVAGGAGQVSLCGPLADCLGSAKKRSRMLALRTARAAGALSR